MKNSAQTISTAEWEKIMLLPIVSKTFISIRSDTAEDMPLKIYGAKFTYRHDSLTEGVIYTLVGRFEDHEVIILQCLNGVFEQVQTKKT